MGIRMTRRAFRGIAATAALASLIAAPARTLAARQVTLPEGSVVPVRLDRDLSSKTAHPGDRFSATVRTGTDDGGIPSGSRVIGVVREAVPAEGSRPGTLDLDFQRLIMPSGSSSALAASLVSLDAKSVRRTPGGRLVASVSKSRDRLKFVGIGAGIGLVAATLTGGKSLQGALIGAAAGAIFNEVKKERPGDVALKAGSEFGVRLDRAIQYSTNRPTYYRAELERGGDDPYYHGSAVRTADVRTEDDRTGRENALPRRDTAPDTAARSADDSRDSDVGVLLDDREVSFRGPKPYVRGGIAYAPVAAVARAAGVDFSYAPSTRSLTARSGKVRVSLDSRVARVGGERKLLKASPEMHGSALCASTDLLALIVDGSAYWDESSRTIVLTSRDAASR